MKKYIFIFFILLIACGKDTLLPKNSVAGIPYKGNEILVFESTKSELDTIFLKGIQKIMSGGDPLDLFPSRYQSYVLNSSHSDPSPPNGKQRYLESTIIEVYAVDKKEYGINIKLRAKDSWFYGETNLTKSELNAIISSEIEINGKKYRDVKIIESDGAYLNRKNHITKVYWSEKYGIIGWDKLNENWRLKNCYNE